MLASSVLVSHIPSGFRFRLDAVPGWSIKSVLWDKLIAGGADPSLSPVKHGVSTMSDLDRNYASPFGRAAGRADAATVDAGLRSYMLKIYNYMAIGLAITGLAALGVYMGAVAPDQASAAGRVGSKYLTSFGVAMFVSPLKWVFILAPLAMVFAISFGINRLKPATAQLLFWAFAALMGISLSSIFLVYTHTSIVRVFFITAATFGALSLYGYTTKRDMTGMGSFLIMGLFGVILASVVNLFLASSMLQFIVSIVGVLVFSGLTAWDTQRLKNDYIYGYAAQGGDVAEKAAITGALSLYLNFINLFTLLLQLLGQRD
jgi:FtsH-binding integral membrane protein